MTPSRRRRPIFCRAMSASCTPTQGLRLWWVLEGEQCLETTTKTIRARAGDCVIVAAGETMRTVGIRSGSWMLAGADPSRCGAACQHRWSRTHLLSSAVEKRCERTDCGAAVARPEGRVRPLWLIDCREARGDTSTGDEATRRKAPVFIDVLVLWRGAESNCRHRDFSRIACCWFTLRPSWNRRQALCRTRDRSKSAAGWHVLRVTPALPR